MIIVNKTKLNTKSINDMCSFIGLNSGRVRQLTIVDVDDMGGLNGRCIKQSKKGHFKIEIENNELYLETLAHEIMHVNHFIYGKRIGLTREQEEMESEREEQRVRERDTTKL